MHVQKLIALASDKEEVDLIKRINPRKLPTHVAIIMDGNGRWAQCEGKSRTAGHEEGAKRAAEICEAAALLSLQQVTLFAFSTENWKRPRSEVSFLFRLLEENIIKKREKLIELQIGLKILGDLTPLKSKLKALIEETIELTGNNCRMQLNIALNYGGRVEIINAVKKIIAGNFPTEELNEENFKQFLYTRDIPDPDLLIRTSNEMRISNFLLYQLAYCELYFSKLFWPEFTRKAFYQALIDYQERQRRFGGI